MTILQGLRVLDFGRYIAGPFCGALLGDLGADVIRIEKVDGSEDRYTAPVTDDNQGSGFMALNRNKRGMTLNPRKPGGQDILRRLVATADVVIANLPPDTLESMGLDYASLAAVKPDIILTTTTAFGVGGPYGNRVGFDGVAQAMSGNMYLTGYEDEPMRNYFPYVDYTTASLNTMATLAAIIHRMNTGEGQHVQGCLLASALTVANGTLIEQSILDNNRVATGNRGQTAAPIDVFRTTDGWILVQVVGNPLFERWAKLMGEAHWLTDPRYATDEARGDNAVDISERMSRWTAERSTAEAMALLADARIACGEVLTPAEALVNEQVVARRFLEPVDYPGLPRPAPVGRMPVDFSTADTGIRRRAPTLGEHTDEILDELGYSAASISEFRNARVV
ncbi:MAG: CoA transferase [Gammaproteobacteria bacterium]|nr:CoA transferase [Gammaproteobacteria bacterium]MYF29127.1 CoA transferase [Gammaproteobacteria bacterium]MYK48290.1 CoA transferase [Gammaproteobacteria bacterium]